MKQPVLFIGHGSPMNAVEENEYTIMWKKLGSLFKPKSILMVSAHWFTHGTHVQSDIFPQKINDMYGFPKELYELEYAVEGDPVLTKRIKDILGDNVTVDDAWGIDHGAWSVLVHMFPSADIPVVQVSVDREASPQQHYDLGKALGQLRSEGVMIIGSGNVVHNLRMINPHMEDGYPWAEQFDKAIRAAVMSGNHMDCIHYDHFDNPAHRAVPTTDHYDPLLYILGAAEDDDKVSVFNDKCLMGGISMTSFLFDKNLTL